MAKRKSSPSDGEANAVALEEVQRRLAGCSGLFARAVNELSSKVEAIRSAPRDHVDPDRQWILEAQMKLEDSAKIGRAIDDLEQIRASFREIIDQLERLTRRRAS